MENIMEFAAFEEIKDGSRNRTAGYTIAWVIGVALVLLIVAAIWNRCHANMSTRNAEACAVSNRLGILEGNMASVKEVLNPLVQNSNEFAKTTAALIAGLEQKSLCNEKMEVLTWSSINKLDNAVFHPRYGEVREGRGRCGGGRPEFERATTFGAPISDNVVVRQDCGNAYGGSY